MLISQVLSDFVGEIKANIGTEIQMGTRYEGDLDRVGKKYGDDLLKSVAKEPVGTGMNVNAEYNNGIPYFISYRPLLHGTKRLTKDELDKYEKYFTEIEDFEYQVGELQKLKVDTVDIELEMKLARDKVKKGKFMMAETYLEALRPKFEPIWTKLGREPMHRVAMRLKKDVVEAGVVEAKSGRKELEMQNPLEDVSFDEEMKVIQAGIEKKKAEGLDTSSVELEMKDLVDRVTAANGKFDANAAAGVKAQFESLKDNVENLKGME
jgi:hypothetical protein